VIFIQPAIDPVIFSFSFIEIRWYSIAYVTAFLFGSYLIKSFNSNIKNTINNKLVDDFFIWAIIGVIIGGRIGYVAFYQLGSFILNPLYIFYIWKGGMSFHGGLIGMIISVFLFSRKNKINFFALADLISLVAPVGLFFGRIANFINTELIGRITNFPLAIIYPSIDNYPRHPSQLYEALFEGLILFSILLFIFLKHYSKEKYGKISGLFLLFYGIFRFLIEFLREPDQQIGLIFNFISMGQLLCVPLIFFGFIILYKKKHHE
jgi:phosphatidylglycerol:prolipoprotein diacylglycerol transferase